MDRKYLGFLGCLILIMIGGFFLAFGFNFNNEADALTQSIVSGGSCARHGWNDDKECIFILTIPDVVHSQAWWGQASATYHGNGGTSEIRVTMTINSNTGFGGPGPQWQLYENMNANTGGGTVPIGPWSQNVGGDLYKYDYVVFKVHVQDAGIDFANTLIGEGRRVSIDNFSGPGAANVGQPFNINWSTDNALSGVTLTGNIPGVGAVGPMAVGANGPSSFTATAPGMAVFTLCASGPGHSIGGVTICTNGTQHVDPGIPADVTVDIGGGSFGLSAYCETLNGSQNRANLSWQDFPGATSYTVQHHIWTGGGWFNEPGGTITGTNFSATVSNNEAHYFRVIANSSGTVSSPGDLFVCGEIPGGATPTPQPPPPPGGNCTESVALSWASAIPDTVTPGQVVNFSVGVLNDGNTRILPSVWWRLGNSGTSTVPFNQASGVAGVYPEYGPTYAEYPGNTDIRPYTLQAPIAPGQYTVSFRMLHVSNFFNGGEDNGFNPACSPNQAPDHYFGNTLTKTFNVAEPLACTGVAGPLNVYIPSGATSHNVYAYGVSGTGVNVWFPTWSDINGQDDIVWYPGTNLGGGTWRATVDLANHHTDLPGPRDFNQFRSHAYMGTAAPASFCGAADFFKPPPPSYYIQCNSGGASVDCSIPSGGSATINWNATSVDPDSCTVTANGNPFAPAPAPSGTQSTGALTGNTKYVLWCNGLDGTSFNTEVDVLVSAPGPTVDNVTISSAVIAPNNTTQYTITIDGSDNSGGANIQDQFALINYEGNINGPGANGGQHRGFLRFSSGAVASTVETRGCTGGGTAGIYTASPPLLDYGTNYIHLDSCSTSLISANTRRTTFVVRFQTSFTTPLTDNDISGYVTNTAALNSGWVRFDTNFSIAIPPACTSSGPDGDTVTGGTRDVYAYGVTNATAVTFYTWSSYNPPSDTCIYGEQDDLWGGGDCTGLGGYPGVNLGGGTWTARVANGNPINFTNHRPGNPDYGSFNVHTYMQNAGTTGLGEFCDFANFNRGTPTGSITGPSAITLGNSGTYNLSGADPAGTNLSMMQAYVSPTSAQSWTQITPTISCTTTTCNGSVVWTPSAPGTYYVVLNVHNPFIACSGNPWVIAPNPPADCGANELITVTVGNPTLGVVLDATPPTGSNPLNTQLRASPTGSATGDVNYSFWWNCSNLSADIAVINGDPSCGVLDTDSAPGVQSPPANTCLPSVNGNGYKCNAISTSPPQLTSVHTYSPNGTYWGKVIVERSVAPPAQAIVQIDVAPSIPSTGGAEVRVLNSNYCTAGLHATVEWNYNDPGGSPQQAWEVQIDNDLDPLTGQPEWEASGTGTTAQVAPANCPVDDATNTSTNPITSPQTNCRMVWNTQYRAWVRAQSSLGQWSSWTLMDTYWNGGTCSGVQCPAPGPAVTSWTTPIHRFPQVSIAWPPNPSSPAIDEPVQFTDATSFAPTATGRGWSWVFTGGNPANSIVQAPPTVMFSSTGSWPITLTVTDNATVAAGSTGCPITQLLNVQRQIPEWREVAPR